MEKELSKIKNIKLANLIFFIISIIHYVILFVYVKPVSYSSLNYIITKIVSLIFIMIFWQLIPIVYYGFKNKDKKVIDFTKHAVIYFSICIIIMLITYPVVKNFDFSYDLPNDIIILKNFECLDFTYITSLFFLISYNILPSAKAMPIVNMFCFSLIFSYIYCALKSNISEKYAKLIYIPFVLPIFLIYNHIPSKRIYLLWCFLFVFFYIFFNQNKKENNYFKAVFLGIVSAICVSFSFEYIASILILPLMVLLLKVFSKKTLIVFFLIFFSLFLCIHKNNIIGNYYILHNLMNTFQYSYIVPYVENKTVDENAKQILEKTYPDLNSQGTAWAINVNAENEQDSKESIKYLTLFAIKHSPYYIKSHLKDCYTEISSESVLLKNFFNERNFNIENYPVKKYLIKILLPFMNDKYIKLIYSIYPAILLLFIILPLSIIKRQSFYIYFTLFQISCLLLSLIFTPFYSTMYYFPIVIQIYIFSFVFLIENKKQA